MAYAPEIRNEAFELYLLGHSPAAIAKELQRRHGDQDTPSAKTIETWAYVPDAGGKTWSERRYEAEAAARDAVTRDFVGAKTKLLAGTLRIQSRLQERVERALDNADDAEPENLTQEVYALLNATKSVDKLLSDRLADEVRTKDAIDCLIEAVRRTVPDFDLLRPKVMAEFQRLANAKAGGGAA